MMPPMPSISRTPRRAAIGAAAELDHLAEIDARGLRAAPPCRARAAPRTARARCARSPSIADGPPERREQHGRVAVLPGGGIEAAHHRLERVDARGRPLRNWRISPAVTKVLPMSVPVAVTKTRSLRATAQRARMRLRTIVGEPLDLGVGMLRGEGEPQARGARRHGRRPDGDDQKAVRLPAAATPPSAASASPRTTGTIGLCRLRQAERGA